MKIQVVDTIVFRDMSALVDDFPSDVSMFSSEMYVTGEKSICIFSRIVIVV